MYGGLKQPKRLYNKNALKEGAQLMIFTLPEYLVKTNDAKLELCYYRNIYRNISLLYC